MSTINKMSNVRGSHWSVTINNPTEKDEEEIALARQKGWSVEGQKEIGESGTPHYQLYVRTPQVRFSAVKKMFSRAHIELAKSPAALANYVHKEETRVGQLSESQDQYPSLSKLWKLLYQWLTECRGYEFEAIKPNNDSCLSPCRVRFLNKREDQKRFATSPLDIFDEFIKDMICSGYHVESMGINPQIRGAWNNYWSAILHRECVAHSNDFADADNSQTDRQEVDVATEINVPIIHNHASLEKENCSQVSDDST